MWILTGADAPEENPVVFRVLPGGMKTVGRAGRADFVVDAALVSRVHCRLVSDTDGRLEVEDLKSTNGTFVNDRRIKKAVLAAGDRLRVGRFELIVTRDRISDQDQVGSGRVRLEPPEPTA